MEIDIKPGSDPNSINPTNKGTIPVAMLSTADFDAPGEVDRTSLTFGRTGDEASLAFCNASSEDVNADGRLDLVCHFSTQQTGFQVGDTVGDTEGILKGETLGGTPLEGKDAVRIIREASRSLRRRHSGTMMPGGRDVSRAEARARRVASP